ncbi:MAG: hypothetical protein ACTSVL_07685 [Promethearchaeota archaeon]
MLFNDSGKKKECKKCGYIMYPPYSEQCPKCGTPIGTLEKKKKIESEKFDLKKSNTSSAEKLSNLLHTEDTIKFHKNKITPKTPNFNHQKQTTPIKETRSQNFANFMKIQSNPGIVFGKTKSNQSKIGDIHRISTKNASQSKKESKMTFKIKQNNNKSIDISDTKLELGIEGEYLRFIGIITKDRNEIYASNPKFQYFLDLTANLQFIATSILSGELDRMVLSIPININKNKDKENIDIEQKDETCYFYDDSKFTYIIYGYIPEKKAAWLLNQIKLYLKDVLGKKNPDKLTKQEEYNFSIEFSKRIRFILKEYIKLQGVFSETKLGSVDDFLRVDFFGLSFQSVELIGNLITNSIKMEEINIPIDPEEEDLEGVRREFQEQIINAKIQAIAVNTFAHTGMMPNWIAVKLGFQHYRFILFSKQNDYYITLLVEGNLELKEQILDKLKNLLSDVTNNPFNGDLTNFHQKTPKIIQFIKDLNET